MNINFVKQHDQVVSRGNESFKCYQGHLSLLFIEQKKLFIHCLALGYVVEWTSIYIIDQTTHLLTDSVREEKEVNSLYWFPFTKYLALQTNERITIG